MLHFARASSVSPPHDCYSLTKEVHKRAMQDVFAFNVSQVILSRCSASGQPDSLYDIFEGALTSRIGLAAVRLLAGRYWTSTMSPFSSSLGFCWPRPSLIAKSCIVRILPCISLPPHPSCGSDSFHWQIATNIHKAGLRPITNIVCQPAQCREKICAISHLLRSVTFSLPQYLKYAASCLPSGRSGLGRFWLQGTQLAT